jgi:hypothetical protein
VPGDEAADGNGRNGNHGCRVAKPPPTRAAPGFFDQRLEVVRRIALGRVWRSWWCGDGHRLQ